MHGPYPNRPGPAPQGLARVPRHCRVNPDEMQGTAVKGWPVCSLHGARGAAPTGSANGRWTGGARTSEMDLRRALSASLSRLARDAANVLAGEKGSREVILSRLRAAPRACLGHLTFEGQGAFASQC